MGLAEIVQRIAADADKEHAEIIQAARQRAVHIRERASADAADERARLIGEARAQAERESDQTLARARLDARNLVLAAKREALDDVEELVLSKVIDLPDAQYRSLIAAAVAERAHGNESILQDKGDAKRLGAAFVKEANEALVAAGKPGELTLAAEHADLGGAGVMLLGDGTEDPVTPKGLVADARHTHGAGDGAHAVQ